MSERPSPEPQPAALPAHVVTPLLTQITQQSLDLDYQLVADRRRARMAAGHEPQDTPKRRMSVPWMGVIVVVGLLLSVSAVQTSRNAPVEELGRGALIKRITEQRAELRTDQAALAKLRTRITVLQTRAQDSRESRLAVTGAAAELETLSGFATAQGPGVVVELTDGPESQDGTDLALVRDEDLAHAVNALWESGATGVAVNGVRLTALSAIRNSGTTVHINRVAVRSPYRIAAVGDSEALVSEFGQSLSGQIVRGSGEQYGFKVTIRPDAAVTLPAASSPSLVAASTLTRTLADEKRSQE